MAGFILFESVLWYEPFVLRVLNTEIAVMVKRRNSLMGRSKDTCDHETGCIKWTYLHQNWNMVVPGNLKWNDDSSQLKSEILSTLDD
jgi:hypothetical protein